jgi:predicted RecA/RadA family phage recombinase
MKNFIQDGNVLPLTAPRAVAAGEGFQVGSLFAVATAAAASSAAVEGCITGVYSLTKVSAQAWTVGAAIYWDNTAFNCTTTVGSNKLIGYAVEAAVNPSSTGIVRLSGN